MLDFSQLFGRKNQSSHVAKDRLKLVLIHTDEFNIEVSSLECDKEGNKAPVLSANIPIKNLKKVR